MTRCGHLWSDVVICGHMWLKIQSEVNHCITKKNNVKKIFSNQKRSNGKDCIKFVPRIKLIYFIRIG